MAYVVSVNLSEQKGTVKKPVEAAELREGHGIVGDAHAGAWHRQVSLLALESVEKMRSLCGADLPYGVFAENFLTQGIDLKTLPVGARLQVGQCVLKITQIGKECHGECEIRRKVGQCVMPTEGVFAVVVEGGSVQPGDEVARLPG